MTKEEIIKALQETIKEVETMPKAEFIKKFNEVNSPCAMNDIKVPPFTDGLKEIIEATEKHKEKCDKIRTNVNKWGRKNICDVDDDIDVLTNEDWFCGLSTEEKAKFLRQIYRDGRDDYVGEWYEQTESDFIEWLKQPHKE